MSEAELIDERRRRTARRLGFGIKLPLLQAGEPESELVVEHLLD
jgi:hypothetical protein